MAELNGALGLEAKDTAKDRRGRTAGRPDLKNRETLGSNGRPET